MRPVDVEQLRRELAARVRARGVADERVLAAIATVPRERFVAEHDVALALQDRPLPIGHDQTISQPSVVARTLELAGVGPDDVVLDVGTGSGYAAAVLARVAGRVVSIERIPALADRARTVLAAVGAGDVEVVVGDGTRGWAADAPYDAIVVAAASPSIPPALTDQLADGGRLVIPVGPRHGVQHLVRVLRDGTALTEERHTPVRFVPLLPDPP